MQRMDIEGQIINKCYIIRSKFDENPFHEVWEARTLYSANTFLLQFVKILNSEIAQEDYNSFKNNFISTYKEQSAYLRMPFELGEYRGFTYTSFLKTKGIPLSVFLQEKTYFPYKIALMIITNIVLGLLDIQKYRISHNLLSPENVWLTGLQIKKSRAQISDFNTFHLLPYVKLFDGDKLNERDFYLAHRVLENDHIESSVQNDIYSAGAIFYRMLAGKPPYQASTILELLKKQKEGEPEQFPTDRDDVPQETVELIYQMLQPNPLFESIEELFENLCSMHPVEEAGQLYAGIDSKDKSRYRREAISDNPDSASCGMEPLEELEVVSDTKKNPKKSQDGPVQHRKFIGSTFAGIRRIFLTIADSWRH